MSLPKKILKKSAKIITKPILQFWAKYDTQYLESFTANNHDKEYLHSDVPLATIAAHKKWMPYVAGFGNKKGMKVLEIGSRLVTGDHFKPYFSKADYVGFDIYPGKNVDVVGDAHKLSTYFPKEEKFDVIYSSAVFEHFAMPWLVAIEISKLLKTGGMLYVETHFSFSSHERPWHFFQYSDMALKVLFSPALGFECIEAGMSNPIVGRFSSLADDYLKNGRVTGLYCHSDYLGKKVKNINDFNWENMNLTEVIGETKYPEPKT
jgi:SAM-dependent methyltransferase